MIDSIGTWMQWRTGSRYSRAHYAEVFPADVRVGSFPLVCGRWAPDAWDADEVFVTHSGKKCRACLRKLDGDR